MGSGKSTVGRKLAKLLNFDFLDLDEEIEKRIGMPISSYFEREGEDAFRDVEKQILIETSAHDNSVISTGGGCPCYHNNMEWINTNGLSIFLDLSPKALFSRLKDAKEHRPLIQNLNDEELLNFIAKHLDARLPFYSQAHISISGINLKLDDLKNQIENFIVH